MEEKETKQQKSNNRAEEELLVPQNKTNIFKRWHLMQIRRNVLPQDAVNEIKMIY